MYGKRFGRVTAARCIDAALDALAPADVADAGMVAFHLPMHTATRLAGPLADDLRAAGARVDATLARTLAHENILPLISGYSTAMGQPQMWRLAIARALAIFSSG